MSARRLALARLSRRVVFRVVYVLGATTFSLRLSHSYLQALLLVLRQRSLQVSSGHPVVVSWSFSASNLAVRLKVRVLWKRYERPPCQPGCRGFWLLLLLLVAHETHLTTLRGVMMLSCWSTRKYNWLEPHRNSHNGLAGKCNFELDDSTARVHHRTSYNRAISFQCTWKIDLPVSQPTPCSWRRVKSATRTSGRLYPQLHYFGKEDISG